MFYWLEKELMKDVMVWFHNSIAAGVLDKSEDPKNYIQEIYHQFRNLFLPYYLQEKSQEIPENELQYWKEVLSKLNK